MKLSDMSCGSLPSKLSIGCLFYRTESMCDNVRQLANTNVAVLLCVHLLISDIAFSADCLKLQEADKFVKNIPSEWTELEADHKTDPLLLFVAAMDSNFSKIKTYSADYAIESHIPISFSLINSLNISDTIFDKDLMQVVQLVTSVECDLKQGKIYRNAKCLDNHYEYDQNKVELNNMVIEDCVSVESPDQYMYSKKGELLTGIKEFPGYPLTPVSKIGRIEHPEYNDNIGYISNLDPFEYYKFKYWSSIDYVLNILEGKYGAEVKERNFDNVHVYEAVDQTGTVWYRYQRLLRSKSEVNVIYNSACGFMPLLRVKTSKNGNLLEMVQVEWTEIENVYVPFETSSISYKETGDVYNIRKMHVSNIKINTPINESCFSLSALNLEDGSLLVDRIQQKIYKITNGKAEFMAPFHTDYGKTEKQPLKINRFPVVCSTLGLILIFYAFCLHFKERRTRGITHR